MNVIIVYALFRPLCLFFTGKSNIFLDWKTRYQIILGIARGLQYLHEDSHIRIVHRDIKASNILLDSKMAAKVADFGLSRLAPVQDDEGVLPNHVSTIVKGTPVSPSLHHYVLFDLTRII